MTNKHLPKDDQPDTYGGIYPDPAPELSQCTMGTPTIHITVPQAPNTTYGAGTYCAATPGAPLGLSGRRRPPMVYDVIELTRAPFTVGDERAPGELCTYCLTALAVETEMNNQQRYPIKTLVKALRKLGDTPTTTHNGSHHA